MSMTAGERHQRIDQYERGPSRLRDALNLVPDEAVRWRPAEGKWSAHEVVCHCADSETNGVVRLRFLLAEKDPVIMGYDQEAVRANATALLRTLGEEAWSRAGRHTDSGPYSMDTWLRIYSDHLEGHARQIERNLEAWRTGGAPAPR